MGAAASCADFEAVRQQAAEKSKATVGQSGDSAAKPEVDAVPDAVPDPEPEPETEAPPVIVEPLDTPKYKGHDLPKDEYDVIVVGGGSGGIACAKEAADHGAKVALCDFVTPSPQGSKWGLGGTCVNVGCIPKKLMHTAGHLGHNLEDAAAYGWKVKDPKHNWKTLTANVKAYIKSLNFGYKVLLKDNKIEYVNAYGKLLDAHTVETTNKKKKRVLKGENIVIAVGGRPIYPNVPGAKKFGITSDDLFTLKKEPGNVLIVGAGYIALESAGFLMGCGYTTTIMMRSIPLRGFDQQMAQLVIDDMIHSGTKFIMKTVPSKLEKDEETNRTRVYWNDAEGEEQSDLFDTVLFATGRSPATEDLGLVELGVEVDEYSKHVIGGHGGEAERSSVPNIYAIGDVLKGCMELTPVAARAGKLLARRLGGVSTEQMDYINTATSVYSPLEYACVGMAEEDAIAKYGEENLETYHTFFVPLEYALPKRNAAQCYMKILTHKQDDYKVLGFHMTGPNAGEIMQGFAVALRCGVTMQQVVSTVGIHPTSAEEFNRLYITKSSGLDPTVHSC